MHARTAKKAPRFVDGAFYFCRAEQLRGGSECFRIARLCHPGGGRTLMYFGFLSIPRVASLGLIEGHRVIGDDRGIRTDSAEFSHPRLRCICRVRSTRATLKRRRGTSPSRRSLRRRLNAVRQLVEHGRNRRDAVTPNICCETAARAVLVESSAAYRTSAPRKAFAVDSISSIVRPSLIREVNACDSSIDDLAAIARPTGGSSADSSVAASVLRRIA